MKKNDLKKLALMGITGGMMLAQTTLSAGNSGYGNTPSNGCSSGQGCHGTNPPPSSANYNTPSSYNSGVTQGCSSRPMPANNNYNNPSSYNGGVTQGCSSKPAPAVNYDRNSNVGLRHGCSAMQNYQNDNSWSDADQPRNYNDPSSQKWGGQGRDDAQDQSDQQQNRREQDSTYPNDNIQSNQSTQPYQKTPSQSTRGGLQAMNSNPTSYFLGVADTTTKAATLTEADLVKQLNSQTKAIYNSLSAEGKALALQLANQSCKGQNTCKGLNSCKTAEHSCAGKGSCANTAAAPFTDKNVAVKVAVMRMAEKRASMNR